MLAILGISVVVIVVILFTESEQRRRTGATAVLEVKAARLNETRT